jgi:hypothetical protein
MGRRFPRSIAMSPTPRDRLLDAAALVAVAFGLATVASGGRALFGGAAAAAAVGAYVPFVLWFNFLAGFAYVAAGMALWLRRRWAAPLAAGIAIGTAAVFALFGLHVAFDGAYEPRTVGAMVLRIGVWAAIAGLAWTRLRRPGGAAR